MRAWLAGLMALAWVGAVQAAPAETAQRDAALAVFQAWNKAVAANKLDDAFALRTAAMRARIREEMKNPARRKQVTEMLKAMVPETVEVQHAAQNRDGSKLTLYTVIGTTMPANAPRRPGAPAPGTKLQSELTLEFLREGGAWKFDTQTWGIDPRQMKACTTAWPGMEGFEERDNLQMGGQIRRVAFAPDHTLVVIRMMDEENCIFLPSRARLGELGFNADTLEPYAIIEIEAWPHLTDKQAAWAASLRVVAED